MSKFGKGKSQKDLGSKAFFDLIRAIGEAKSKQEEDKIILKEIATLKGKMTEKDVDPKVMKEYVVRMLYCEMLGHEAEFGYIKCVELTASKDLLQKRTGYLGVELTISPESELQYLIVANIQKDLQSESMLVRCAALGAATKLIRGELMPAIIQDVEKCLQHDSPLVRKKAIVCIHAFWRRNDAAFTDVRKYQETLCDKDPAVMACTLSFLHDLCILAPEENNYLVDSFVLILKQICENRLHKEYDYHRVPAPWIQIKLLKLLAILCHNDEAKSDIASGQLMEVMKRYETGFNIGHAVIYECVKTITCVVQEPLLMQQAADAIGKFMKSTNPNLKYLGITSLSRIVLIDPQYAAEHKETVMDCLEDHDETIKRKTLNLLCAMTNADTVEVIVERLLVFLSKAHDQYLKQELVQNITELAYLFYPSMDWYISTMNHVIRLGYQYVDNQIVQGMLKMIAEGSEELDDEANERFRRASVELYYNTLESDKLPDTLMQIIAWVLGEYGFMFEQCSQDDIIDKLCDALEKVHEETDTRGYIITALMKLTAQMPQVPSHVTELVSTYKSSFSLALQQRCYEFLELAKHPQLMSIVLPLDGCCEDLEVDPDLTFLDEIVERARLSGAKDYRPKESNFAVVDTGPALRTDEYVNPVDTTGAATHNQTEEPAETDLELDVGNAGPWGAELLEPEKPDDAPLNETDPGEDEDEVDEDDAQLQMEQASSTGKKPKKGKKAKEDKFASMIFGGGGAAAKTKTKKTTKKKAKSAQPSMDGSPAPSPVASSPVAAAPVAAAPVPLNQQLMQLQPGQVTMANYPQLWGQNPAEGSGMVQLPVAEVNIEELARHITAVTNITKVETIGKEFVAAATHPQRGWVMAHFAHVPVPENPAVSRLTMKIRTADPNFTNEIVAYMQQHLIPQA
eukprot:TRINITY_DN11575_c0_g1_i1.p1 TRINITY_DN11575_c0_g1~~TRINITY_DN11575_c0_g1_i1.p1  ORF type:complete len:912 (+),score=413.36 TRINITY_DN11575_c0_g1_i1:98-2833(+)